MTLVLLIATNLRFAGITANPIFVDLFFHVYVFSSLNIDFIA